MRQQLLPLLFCLLTSFSGWSSVSNNTNNYDQTHLLTSNNIGVTAFKSSINKVKITSVNSIFNSRNKGVKNQVLYYNSENQKNGGISTSSVFSYNLIDSPTVSSATNFSALHLNPNLFSQGLFYGFALTVILLNLVCFFVFDETLFVLFAATLATLTTTLFFTEGLFPLIGLEGVVQTEISQSTFLLFAISLSAFFASKYLTVKDFYPKLHHITIPLLAISSLLVSMAWITSNVFMANIANTILFGLISIYFLVGVLLFSRKNYAKFYVIASFIPLLFSVDFFVLQNFGLDFLFTEAVHLKIAVLFEALLLSYAILYRMQAVKEEGVLRQTEMRIFLKRQDVMSRTKVEEMIEDIYLENLIMQYDLDGLEIKLLQYISEGKTNTKIARKLKVTESEISEYTKELYQKLEISEHIKEDHRMVDNQPDFIYN